MNRELSVCKFVTAILATLVMATNVYAQSSGIYTWTDENGTVHFSDMQPENRAAQRIEISARAGFVKPPNGTLDPEDDSATTQEQDEEPVLTPAQQRRKEMEEAREARQIEQAEAQRWCDRHRKRLIEMEPARRVYTYDENGQQVRMDDDRRIALIEESRSYLSENCQ